MNNYNNIIFDLDGTLIDSFGDIAECLKKAYTAADAGRDVMIEKTHLGPPIKDIIKKITPNLDDEDVNRVYKEFRSLYDNCDFSNTTAYMGVRDLLRDLKESKRRTFLITNKPCIPTKQILGSLGLDYFEETLAPDMAPGGSVPDKSRMLASVIERRKLKRSESVVVGDGASDIMAAKDNEVVSVGVLYGYSKESDILAAKPDFTAKDVAHLRSILFSKSGG